MSEKRTKARSGPLCNEFPGDPFPNAVLSPEGMYLGASAGWETAVLWQAAPDMLAALRDLVWLANDHDWEDDSAIVKAREVIDRAEGRAT